MSENQFSVEIDWNDRFEFTEEQWLRIVESLENVAIGPNVRHWLCQIAWTHESHRRQPSDVPVSRKRKRLQRIAKAAAELRDAIRNREEHVLDDHELARAVTPFEGIPDLEPLMVGWLNFERILDLLQKIAEQEALSYEGKKSRPANIDDTLNYTLESLAEVYEKLIGTPPKPRVGINEDNDGIAYGPFVDFVMAFMEALPRDERVTGDQINHFLRRRSAQGEHL